MESQGIQINKYISSTGFCSRREADLLVEQGRVTINRKLAKPISRVNEGDRVAVDDEVLKSKTKEALYIAFHKPKGITSTTDEKDRSSITKFINHDKRIFPVGRLDKDSEGLILLTDDGDIVNKILRAGNEHEKEYIVTVDKPITPGFVKHMSEGVDILDTTTRPCIVKSLGNKKFKIILTQGLNRQIRRMCEVLGYKVSELKRIRIMHIHLDDLPLGKWRKLNSTEVERMHEFVKGSSKTAAKEKWPTPEKKRPAGKTTSADSKFKHAPQFNREAKTNKKESKFIRPFKAGDEVLKKLKPATPQSSSVKYPAGIENQKNRFSKVQAKMKFDSMEAAKEIHFTPKAKAKGKGKAKFVTPEPKDKLTLKKEKNMRSKEHLAVKAKHSSRKNFNSKPNKKRPTK